MSAMLISRIQLGELAALGQHVDWPREATEDWPTARLPDEYLLIWHKDDANLPDTLVVPTSVDQFFAWSTTYLPNLTPLSSLVRVVERDWRPKAPARSDFDVRVLLGLCVAETAASYSKFDLDDISLFHCTSSLTYCLLQGTMLGTPPVGDDLAHKWEEVRYLLGLPKPKFHVPHLLETWQQATMALGDSRDRLPVSSAREKELADFLARALGSNPNGSSLRNSPPYDAFLRSMASGPLEDRVRRFKEMTQDILGRRVSEIDDNLAGIMLGFGLSEISGGTFRHSHLIGPSLVRDVRPLLWYGCFEAAKGVARGEGWLAGGTGLRLRRELASLPHMESDSDISIEELRVLARGTKGALHFATKHAGLARVLLQPGITVELEHGVRVPPRIEPAPRERQYREEASLPTAEVYRNTLLHFLRESNKRIFFTTSMKVIVDPSSGKPFDFLKEPGLPHAELVAVPLNGPFIVRMTTPSYHHRVQGRKLLVVTEPHELSIPVEYLDAAPWRDSTYGYVCLSLNATLKLYLGKWTVDRG